MNTEHTPGPWYTSSAFGVISNDEVICRVRRIRKGQGEANARIIAAAPDLLEALKAIEACNVWLPFGLLAQTRAAIAKAEGKV